MVGQFQPGRPVFLAIIGGSMNIRIHNRTWHTLLGEGIRWGVVAAVSAGALLVLAKYIG